MLSLCVYMSFHSNTDLQTQISIHFSLFQSNVGALRSQTAHGCGNTHFRARWAIVGADPNRPHEVGSARWYPAERLPVKSQQCICWVLFIWLCVAHNSTYRKNGFIHQVMWFIDSMIFSTSPRRRVIWNWPQKIYSHTGSINQHSGQNGDPVQVLSACIMSIRHEWVHCSSLCAGLLGWIVCLRLVGDLVASDMVSHIEESE